MIVDGNGLGFSVGNGIGYSDGDADGLVEGEALETCVGASLGTIEGAGVGLSVIEYAAINLTLSNDEACWYPFTVASFVKSCTNVALESDIISATAFSLYLDRIFNSTSTRDMPSPLSSEDISMLLKSSTDTSNIVAIASHMDSCNILESCISESDNPLKISSKCSL